MGVVYEAVRESLRSHVALKVMHPQYRNREKYLRRFRTEARSAARLHHTNIVSVFDYGVHDGVCYYAMQYIAGHSLDKILADVRQLRQEKAGFAAGETATLASGPDGRPLLGEMVIQHRAGCPGTDPSRETVTIGLLTGLYPIAVPAEASDDGATSPLPTGDAGTGGASGHRDQIKVRAAKLAVEMCTAVGDEIDHTGATPGALGFETGRAQAVFARAHEPPPDSGDDLDALPPSPDGSASSLIGKSDARYYREVARLGAQVADALAYAHKRGVLHRDIKPPNLILDTLGNIWITDFGLAKFEEGDDLSQSHDLVGTLRYMAPERFRGVSDPRCDLYALGATLYELLTLRPPFQGQDQLQLIRRIENDAPVPPRQLERGIPPDLETIVLKALAKNPDDRFATAEEMAAELRRVVENRPIRSRPVAFYQRFWRWCKRNPGLAGANIAAAALTTILAIVSTVAAWTYREQRDQIGANLVRITGSEAAKDQGSPRAALRGPGGRAGRFSHRAGQRFDSLDALREAAEIARELRLPPEKFDLLRDQAIACMALPDLKHRGRIITKPAGVIATAFDSTMTRYAVRFRDGTISVRRIADDAEIARFEARGDRGIFVFGFSPDGRYLATTHFPKFALTVWDIDRRVVGVNDPGPVHGGAARFSPDSRRLALVNGSRELLVYDLATGRPSGRWSVPGLGGLAFRPDGAQIAVIDNEPNHPTCRILEAETGRLVQSIPLQNPRTVRRLEPRRRNAGDARR